MKSKKLRVGILFGGRSAEHEISLLSAGNIIEALDRNQFDPILIGIDKEGCWRYRKNGEFYGKGEGPSQPVKLDTSGEPIIFSFQAGESSLRTASGETLSLDVIFPILHGPMGEDGTVQGLLTLLGIPYVGSAVLGSAVGMDKDVMKRLLRDAGLPVLPWITLHRWDMEKGWDTEKIFSQLGPQVFVKPANMGSSVGVTRARTVQELNDGIQKAFHYDHKVLIEKGEVVREIEVAVLDGVPPSASIAGEIVPHREFYSYEAKYIDEKGADLVIPARLDSNQMEEVRTLALKTFSVLETVGLGRVDFFMTASGSFFINEINTMPGFTKISMFPALWKRSGVTYSGLIEKLILMAIERGKVNQMLRTDYFPSSV